MQLLSPAILWALAALAVPILVHLFYFRRFKRVEFSNVRFLTEVRDETQRRSRIRNLLVLSLRLLAFAALVVAFAQPFVAANGSEAVAPPRINIVVDNSQSMSARTSEVTLLDKAKQRARDIIRAYGEATEFRLVTNDLDGASTRWYGREDALAAVEGIGFGVSPQTGAQLLSRTMPRDGTIDEPTPTYLISDFQRTQFDLSIFTSDTMRSVAALPIAALELRNLSIDSAYLLSPLQLLGEPVAIVVEMTNHGTEDAEAVKLSAVIDGSAQPFGLRRVPAGATVSDTLILSVARAGWVRAEIAITDFPIEFDDRYYIAFEVRDRLRALVISDAEARAQLRAAFPPDGTVALSTERSSNVNYSQLRSYDLVILDGVAQLPSGLVQALGEAVELGGKVMIFPSAAAAAPGTGYGPLLAALGLPPLRSPETGEFVGGRVNTRSFVFAEVFDRLPDNMRLPQSKLRFNIGAAGDETLLSFRDGSPFVVGSAAGRGIAYLSAAPLDADVSDFARSAEIFVPMLYRMAYSGGAARAIAYTIGQVGAFEVPVASVGEGALTLRSGQESFVPPQRTLGSVATVSFGQTPTRAGHFALIDPADSTLAVLGFNYSRAESPMSFHSAAALAEAGLSVYDGDSAAGLQAGLGAGALGKPWWPTLVALALLALIAEALVLRFWRPNATAAAIPPRGV